LHNKITVYHLCWENIDEDFRYQYFLSKLQQQQLEAFYFSEDKKAYYYSKLLLLLLLKKHNTDFTLEDLQYTSKGKPIHPNAPEFNLSHSNNSILLAIGEDKNIKIGVDIQMHKKLDKTLFQKYFSSEEWIKAKESDEIFFNFWTIKEAIIKAEGSGMTLLKSTSIVDDFTASCEDNLYYYSTLDQPKIHKGNSASIASDKPFTIVWKDLSLENLFEELESL
jgi:4'-phosphopantetheinyl transferase